MSDCNCKNLSGSCSKIKKRLLKVESDLTTLYKMSTGDKRVLYKEVLDSLKIEIEKETCPDNTYTNGVINFVANEYREHNN